MASADNARGGIAVTGIGIVTSLGQGVETNWQRLTAGESGIHAITRFSTEGLRTTIAGTVDFLDIDPLTQPRLSYAMADAATAEALARCGLADEESFPGGLFVAAAPIEHDWRVRERMVGSLSMGRKSPYSAPGQAFRPTNGELADLHAEFLNGSVADLLADRYRTRGSPITLTTACASGASAIQLGVEAIRRGEAPAALAVGTDGSIQEEALIRFSLLSALSTKNDPPEKASRPFSKNRDGFVMAEGAAALVLEDAEHAKARGAAILAYVRGCGEASDTFHRTRSNPNGRAIIRSIQDAIDDAGLAPDDIGYVNAHGTGTPENDKMEYLGIRHVFGERAEGGLPISSNKSMIGHTLSAAGAIEAAFSILALIEGVLPPTINYEVPDPALPVDAVPNQARQASPAFALSNSFGFGGQNVSLVLAHADTA